MARRGYPPEFRRRVVDLVEGGRKVAEVAAQTALISVLAWPAVSMVVGRLRTSRPTAWGIPAPAAPTSGIAGCCHCCPSV
jgi:hypothetical protein